MLWADIPIKGEEPLDRNIESRDNLIRQIAVYGDVSRAREKKSTGYLIFKNKKRWKIKMGLPLFLQAKFT